MHSEHKIGQLQHALKSGEVPTLATKGQNDGTVGVFGSTGGTVLD